VRIFYSYTPVKTRCASSTAKLGKLRDRFRFSSGGQISSEILVIRDFAGAKTFVGNAYRRSFSSTSKTRYTPHPERRGKSLYNPRIADSEVGSLTARGPTDAQYSLGGYEAGTHLQYPRAVQRLCSLTTSTARRVLKPVVSITSDLPQTYLRSPVLQPEQPFNQ
jgi:hypothetical protein